MFVPLGDQNPIKRIRYQYVTLLLILANVLAYVLEAASGSEPALIASFAVIPGEFFQALGAGAATGTGDAIAIPEIATLLSYMFLHGDLIHLGGNMLFLWVFGDNVEDALGHFRFLLFYFACAAAGAFAHGIAIPDSQVPLIGASGAISGIVAAYLMLHPRVKVWILAFARIPLRVPAYVALVLWIVFQFAMLIAAGEENVSFAAHVGGIIAGAILVVVMRRRGVPLFDRQIVTPRAVETAAPPPATAEPAVPPSPWGRR